MCFSLFPLSTIISAMCIVFHLRKTNQMVMDSCCRGGIVNTRGVCTCMLLVQSPRPKALSRLRASTSNSLSGRSGLQPHMPIRYIDHTYAQQGIRVCEDDPFEPPIRQYANPMALSLLRVSI